MSWEDIITKKTKRRMRGAFERRGHSSLFQEYEQYDQEELLDIFIMILNKVTDGEASKYESDAYHNLMEIKEDGTEEQHLKGMDEREYILRYILMNTRIGEKRITLNMLLKKIFGDKDFKLG